MSVYVERPWLGLYGPGIPYDIEPEHASMLAAYQATAAQDPERIAVRYFDREIAYRELQQLTDALAAGLQDEGFQAGERLAVYLQNVPQFVIAMIATWKAGGIMVSVSPMLKHKELTAQLVDTGATVLITHESLWAGVAREVVPETDVRITITTSELDFLEEVPELLAEATRDRDDATVDLWRSRSATGDRGRVPRRSDQMTSPF
jgi:long-chain acyl-CoA synthetase